MLASLIPVTALQLPLLIPSHFFPKSPFPICHHAWVQCPRYAARGVSHPALPASGFFEIWEPKTGFFSLLGLIPQVFVKIAVAEELPSALEL